MPLNTPGDAITTDDFIYRSEAQTDRTDDHGRVPKLESDGRLHVDFSLPSGIILPFAGSSIGAGFLLCDGASYLRADYPELFAVIGTTYGSADGTHFNVPNLKGRVIVGQDTGQTEFDTIGESGGAKTTPHTHAGVDHLHYVNINSGNQNNNHEVESGGGAMVSDDIHSHNISGYTGGADRPLTSGSSSPSILQPYLVANYVIKT